MLYDLRREGIRLLLLGLVFAAPVSLAFVGRFPLPVVGIWLVTVVTLAAAPHELWPELDFGSGFFLIFFGAALAWVAAFFAFLAAYAITIEHSLCGNSGTTAPGVTALVLYAAGGSWALAGRPRRALLGWPAAVILAFAVALAVTAALPGAHGYCET
jgi:hypothetical protein